MEKLGFNIRNIGQARAVFASIQTMGYNPATILTSITQIGNLQVMLTGLTKAVGEEQTKLTELLETKRRVINDLQTLNAKKRAEEKAVVQAGLEAEEKISAINQRLINKMIDANVTEQQLQQHLADREKLQKWG